MICSNCKQNKSTLEFDRHQSNYRGYSYYCKDCMKLKYDSNRGNDYLRRKIKRDQKKRQVMLYYSHGDIKCRCCGERRMEFLTMDHISNDGAEHRRQIGRTPQNLYKWIIDNNFPKGFQVLCFNCNCAKEYSGYCPHQNMKHNPKLWQGLFDDLQKLVV